jgi:hypothetical protein
MFHQTAAACSTDKFYVYTGKRGIETPLRILDKKGFIKVQCSNACAEKVLAKDYQKVVDEMWQNQAVFKSEAVIRPNFFICAGPRVTDYSAVDVEQDKLLMDLDISDRDPDEEIIVVGDVNDIG